MFAAIVRLFKTEPALIGSVASAVYAAAVMLWRAQVDHTGVMQPDVLVAAVVAVWGVWTRVHVTPLARPRDRQGCNLINL